MKKWRHWKVSPNKQQLRFETPNCLRNCNSLIRPSNAALLSALDDGLACAIIGIPLADIPAAMIQHGLLSAIGRREPENLDPERMVEIMRVVSPLVLEPRLPVDKRFLFAGIADRLVPPEQAVRLWEHWDRPRLEWYQGAHMTYRAHPSVRLLIEEGLRSAALAL